MKENRVEENHVMGSLLFRPKLEEDKMSRLPLLLLNSTFNNKNIIVIN